MLLDADHEAEGAGPSRFHARRRLGQWDGPQQAGLRIGTDSPPNSSAKVAVPARTSLVVRSRSGQ